jgi:hypothetical protein
MTSNNSHQKTDTMNTMNIIASQVEIGQSYFIESKIVGYESMHIRTITDIIRTNSGRYVFVSTSTHISKATGKTTVQYNCKSTAVVGHKGIFQGVYTK